MNWLQSLTKAIQYIESHLTHAISLNDIADEVYASNAHFQRVFNLVTGMTMGDYIRNRRLSLAGQDLLDPKNKIIDIAMKYQYDTSESFSKAFARFHQVTPSGARKNGQRLKYFRPLTINITINGGFDMYGNLEILSMAQYSACESDSISDLPAGTAPPRSHGKIQNYRRIQNWENYFLCSAICSVALKLGAEDRGYKFYANFTGDNFVYLYAADKGNPTKVQCDSGVTNYFFTPHSVKKAFASFGYECIYISNTQIKKDFKAVMDAIKASVDGDIPVLAWGMGNVTTRSGNRCDPMPEGCLIGGYDENDVLYVQLYPGEERMPEGSLDEYGYSKITNGLDTTNGLFFAGAKIENSDMRKIYQDAIDSIPSFLTLPPFDSYLGGRYAFGKTAFEIWAATLVADEYFENKTDDELGGICWDLHCAPFCCLCTNTAYEFIKETTEIYPDIKIAGKILPLYKKMGECKDAIWQLHGGFFPPMEKFRKHSFRAQLAEIIKSMGG
ncbi:MAG: AraC family transcriptional regulator, partial [Oscillospiraceae bacterium]|nr:AraC family transcriptional regulator [Oscillospiraceae bacterium]